MSSPYRTAAANDDVPQAVADDSAETFEAKRARLLASKKTRDAEREAKKRAAEVERLELAERFERELGPEGEAFAVYDASSVGEGIFVIKLGEAVLYTTFMESKMTPGDRYDFVSSCIVHPSKAAYDQAQLRRPGINVELSNKLAALFGLKIKADEGK